MTDNISNIHVISPISDIYMTAADIYWIFLQLTWHNLINLKFDISYLTFVIRQKKDCNKYEFLHNKPRKSFAMALPITLRSLAKINGNIIVIIIVY